MQQFSLVSQISCLISEKELSIELRTQAVRFAHQFLEFFNEDYLLTDLGELRQDLNEYRRDVLKPNLKEESVRLKKGKSSTESIQNYLEQILKKDVIVMRFIFNCSRVRNGKLFDEMFRDYIENLKRRYTAGTRLIGHVGVYIPYKKDHYIDATLFFEFNEQEEIKSQQLKEEVIKYWKEYASIKVVQIEDFNKRHGQSDKVIHNPFDEYVGRELTAISVPIVKTENLLNDTYIEVRQGQNKVIELLIECVTRFYAYCPIVLTSLDDLTYLPRKNYLILGRIRTKKSHKREKDLQQNGAPKIESIGENLESYSVASDTQNEVIESSNSDFFQTGYMPSEISESIDQMSQQKSNFQDALGKILDSNQEHDPMPINTPNLTFDANHTVQIKESEQKKVLAKEKVIYITPKKKHAFVKPDPDQIAAEAIAKSKNKDT